MYEGFSCNYTITLMDGHCSAAQWTFYLFPAEFSKSVNEHHSCYPDSSALSLYWEGDGTLVCKWNGSNHDRHVASMER